MTTTAQASLALLPGEMPDPPSGTRRTLYCYASERLAHRLRDLVDVQAAACRIAVARGYQLGPLFIEEDDSGQAMDALISAATSTIGGSAVAVPHRGHFVPLGPPDEWQQLLEQITGRPVLFIRPTP